MKEKLNIATPEAEFLWKYRHELAPFFISTQHLPLNKYVYVLPDTIIKVVDHEFTIFVVRFVGELTIMNS